MGLVAGSCRVRAACARRADHLPAEIRADLEPLFRVFAARAGLESRERRFKLTGSAGPRASGIGGGPVSGVECRTPAGIHEVETCRWGVLWEVN